MPKGALPGERRGGFKKQRGIKNAAKEVDYKFLDLHSRKIADKIKAEAVRAAEQGQPAVNAHRTQKIIATHLRQIIATMPRAVDIMRYVCKTHIDNFQRAEDKGALDMESLERAAYWAERIAPYETPKLQAVLAANTVFNVLNPQFVKRLPFELDAPFKPLAADGAPLGMTVTAFPVPHAPPAEVATSARIASDSGRRRRRGTRR
mgnify:CR=1 FL=1